VKLVVPNNLTKLLQIFNKINGNSGGARKKSWGGPLKLVGDKLFKASQNRPIIELFKIFGWATSSFCGNLDQPKPKTDINLYKISQSRPIIVDFLIFPGGPWPTPAHEGLRH